MSHSQYESKEIFKALDVGVEIGFRFPSIKPTEPVQLTLPTPSSIIPQINSPTPGWPNIKPQFMVPKPKPELLVAFIRFRADIGQDLFSKASWGVGKSAEATKQPIQVETLEKNETGVRKRFFNPEPIKSGLHSIGHHIKSGTKEVAKFGASLVSKEQKTESHLYKITYRSITIPSKGITVILGIHRPLDSEKDPVLYEIGVGKEFISDYIKMVDPSTREDERLVYMIEFLVSNYAQVPLAGTVAKYIAQFIIIRLGTETIAPLVINSPAFAKLKDYLNKFIAAPLKPSEVTPPMDKEAEASVEAALMLMAESGNKTTDLNPLIGALRVV